MKVLVNFLPLLGRGGGRQNARNLWRQLARDGHGHAWHAVARPNLELETLPRAPHLTHEARPVGGLMSRLWLENRVLPRMAAEGGYDVLFTPMGAGPLRSSVPRVVGWHDSTVFYPESPMWQDVSAVRGAVEAARARYARACVQGAEVVCVQTEVMAARLSAAWGVPEEDIRVVPNGPSTFLEGEGGREEGPAPDPARILVVTTTQPAKNIGVLDPVARALGRAGVEGAEIVATLPEPRGWRPEPGAVPVRWIGSVAHDELGGLYRSGSAVLVPSFMESFTAVYVEAWQFGLPIVTSDLDFARGMCGGAALYAPPGDPDALAAALAEVLRDDGLRRRLVEEGERRFRALPTWEERTALYVGAVEAAVAPC